MIGDINCRSFVSKNPKSLILEIQIGNWNHIVRHSIWNGNMQLEEISYDEASKIDPTRDHQPVLNVSKTFFKIWGAK